MAIFKANIANQFTQIPNETLQDTGLTAEAKGVLVTILSLPSDWEIHKTWLQKQFAKTGRDKLERIIRELTEAGYMVKKPKQDEKGKMLGWDWYVYPVKQLQPSDSKASTVALKTRKTGNPLHGKTPTTNKHINKETSSESVNTRTRENFHDRVMTELLTIGLDEQDQEESWYAGLKISEYRDRFPTSESVADCCSYVVQGLQHRRSLTGQ